MSALVAVAAFGSSRVHAATERDETGRFIPLCGGVNPWRAASSDAPINCPRCLKALTGGEPMSAERCPTSGKKVSVDWDDWATAETATCPHCGSIAKWRVRATDTPPWGRIAPHRTDGTPCR